ncbi:MAG: DUF4097 domain-containing protein [Gammaproteobacteria bacterium]|nr:DUF4097 domain-containing protein [Gammaproteobacteria bacterium]
MKRLICNAASAAIALAAANIAAAEEFREIMDVSPESYIEISNTAGDIEVEGWSRNQVEVIGELGRGVEDLIFERHGDEVVIKVKVPRRNSSQISSDLHIKAPERSSLNVYGVSADIDVSGIRGEMKLATVSGDVDVEVYGEDVEVSSVSGDVELQGDDEDMRADVHSVSGDVDVQNLSGEIEAGSVSGDLAIVDSSFDRAMLNTTNGDLVFRGELRKGGRMDMETINGEVDLRFRGKVSAKFDISTFNGRINNCFGPKPERTSKYTPGYEVNFTEGDGDGRVSINTLNGGVRLCKD